MRKFLVAIFAMVLVALSFVVIAPAANAGTDKIGICHATGNGKYVPIEVAKSAALEGHNAASHQMVDIIPAFSFINEKIRYYFEGQNLDKAAYLNNGCVSPVETVTASPIAPVYVPASCARPNLPYGEVVVPADRGTGVSGVSDPRLNTDNTAWSVSYALATNTDTKSHVWPTGFDGSYNFTVVPLTDDPLFITDSKTGKGECTLPETGAGGDYMPYLGGAAILIALGVFMMARTNKRQA